MSLFSARLGSIGFIIIVVLVSGCETVHYYGQAIHGQVAILTQRRPIKRLLAASQTPEALKGKLRQVLSIRRFAKTELALPVNRHYLSYVALNRPYVVWNVFAAPEFSLTPKTWRYPFIGRSAYRGYFSKDTAIQFADRLKGAGWDVHTGPVAAYSTLGWFKDPILSTFIDRSEIGLAALIFHELAHQILYVDDDTTFNESFATAVEKEGVRRWALSKETANTYNVYLRSRQRRLAFNQLVLSYRDRLELLYRQALPDEVKRDRKTATIQALREAYQELRKGWGGYSGYDTWIAEPINNAKLISIATYHQLVPKFEALLQRLEGDLNLFYQACRELAQQPKELRLKALRDRIKK